MRKTYIFFANTVFLLPRTEGVVFVTSERGFQPRSVVPDLDPMTTLGTTEIKDKKNDWTTYFEGPSVFFDWLVGISPGHGSRY
jgi:hypothetical protein